MLTRTKIALAVALLAGSASVASAQGFDPNPANRYPHYAAPECTAHAVYRHACRRARRRTSPRSVHRGPAVRAGAPPAGPQFQPRSSAPMAAPQYGAQQDEIGVDLQDRASSPYAGGVN